MDNVTERVTVTLPGSVVREIERVEKNRSKFILVAVRRELQRRRRESLRLSLRNPHPETVAFADPGIQEWADSLPQEDAASLVNLRAGRPVRWVAGEGWKVE
jgi:hypothetical protein